MSVGQPSDQALVLEEIDLLIGIGRFAGVAAAQALCAASKAHAAVSASGVLRVLRSELPPEILVIGGRPPADEVVRLSQRWGASCEWQPLAASGAQTPRSNANAAVLGGRVYVVGGYGDGGQLVREDDVLDIQANTWSRMPPMPTRRAQAAGARLGRELIVAGGFGADGLHLSSVECFSPATGCWRELPPMPGRRACCAAAWVSGVHVPPQHGGSVCVVGGLSASGRHLASVERFCVDGQEWTSIPRMPTDRVSCAVVGWREWLYVIGGWGRSTPMAEVVRIAPAQDDAHWEALAPMPTRRASCAVAAAGALFVFGGRLVGAQATGVVERYDPATNSWDTLPGMRLPRTACIAVPARL